MFQIVITDKSNPRDIGEWLDIYTSGSKEVLVLVGAVNETVEQCIALARNHNPPVEIRNLATA